VQKVVNFVLGFVMGGLVGGSLAILFAPMSGNRLRTEFGDYTRQVRLEVEQAATNRRLELERELANLRGEVITD
jgi:gas vesicle protein